MMKQEKPWDKNNIFAEIDFLKRKIASFRPLTKGEIQRLRDEFTVEYTFDSNAIEGNTLTLRETAMVLEGVTIDKKPLKDHLEAIGHRDAFNYILEMIQKQANLTERFAKEIHSLVLIDRPEDKGVYRSIPVRILGAFHTPPLPVQIPEKMEQLIAEYGKSTLHPIEKAALFHLKFEGIHPFIDGNGRTGRLILNFSLMKNGYLPVDVKFADRKRYYDAFDSYYRDKTSEPMIQLISEYEISQENRFFSILKIKGEKGP